MAKETWFISDTHFTHRNIIKFKDDTGKRIRPFSSLEEHDETIIKNFNELVGEYDRVYFMGDCVINRRALPILSRLKGKKKLIKGNHDIFKLKDYTPYFEDILACRVYQKHNFIVTHIPIHPSNLYRFNVNFHGHTHSNCVTKKVPISPTGDIHEDRLDFRYKNLCLEHTDFKPVNITEMIQYVKEYFPCQKKDS